MILVTIKDASYDSVTETFEDWHFPFYSDNEAKAFVNMLKNDEGLQGLDEHEIIFSDIDVRGPKYNAKFQHHRFYMMMLEEGA
jgi:hypothetical protein